MVSVLGHQHLGQQPCGGNAFVDHMRLDRRLGDGLALHAGPLAADVALHREHAGHIVELLGHVFADALHPAAALAGGRLGFVADLAPGQVGRQKLAGGGQPGRVNADHLRMLAAQLANSKLAEPGHVMRIVNAPLRISTWMACDAGSEPGAGSCTAMNAAAC